MIEIFDVLIVDDCIMNEFCAEDSIWKNVSVFNWLCKFDELLLNELNSSIDIERNTLQKVDKNESDCSLKADAKIDRMTSK